MATSWTQTATEIGTAALEHLGVVASGETAEASHLTLAQKALDGILKEMPIHGFSWDKVSSTPTLLTWSAGTPNKVSLPADYIGQANVSYTVNSSNKDLELITKAQYDAIIQPDYVAQYPLKGYIDSSNVMYLWPVPSADPSMYITYEAIRTDAVSGSTPNIPQYMINMLGYWVAYELRLKFSATPLIIQEIKDSLQYTRELSKQFAAETSPIRMTVMD